MLNGTRLNLMSYRHELPPRELRKLKDYLLYPFLLIKCYFKRIISICQWRFIFFLIISQMIVKGLLYRLTMSGMLPIFKNLGVGAADLQVYMTIAMSPWSIKPIVGILSDLIAFRGYHKRYWLIISIVVGTTFAGLMFASATLPLWLLLCYMGLNYELAIVDLLTEGKYAEKMQKYPEIGSDLVTFVHGLQTVGSIIAMSFIGHVADEKAFWVFFLISVIAAVSPLIPSMLGWLPEDRVNDGRHRWFSVDKPLFNRNRAMFIVIGFTGLAGPVVAFLATYTNRFVGLISALLLLTGSLAGSYLAFPRVIAHIGLYQVVSRLVNPSMGTALDYFYTADKVCLPDGPHFSFKYYITYTGIAAACVAFVAVWLYQAFLSKWRFRSVLVFTSCLVGFGGVADMLIVLRVNRRLGISDHAFYFFGDAVFETMVDMLYWIPSSVIISKVCPRGMESATYAFIAGISNFALMVAELLGAIIFSAAGVKKCSFDALWWLILCFHIALPVIGGIPATLLIPNLKQDAVVLEENEPPTPRSVITLTRTEDHEVIEFDQFITDEDEF